MQESWYCQLIRNRRRIWKHHWWCLKETRYHFQRCLHQCFGRKWLSLLPCFWRKRKTNHQWKVQERKIRCCYGPIRWIIKHWCQCVNWNYFRSLVEKIWERITSYWSWLHERWIRYHLWRILCLWIFNYVCYSFGRISQWIHFGPIIRRILINSPRY